FEPHTIWECYSPSKPEPGQRHKADSDSIYLVRDDFCGWSALGPISLFIENVIGFHNIDAANRLIEWRKKGDGRQGMENLRFGDITTDIIAEGNQLSVKSDNPYTLVVNGIDYKINPGDNRFTTN
ncbi:MAG: alpha,alpha-trehalase, partial [Muribaculaceae bacterium]|nr:alpha,alpha-trehalase [Muribaculaceae bacterium]